MAKFKYLGKDGVRVGRFGKLSKGDVVDLWEGEAEYVRSHSTDPVIWKEVVVEEDLEGVGTIVPALTKHFDLRRVFWLKEARAYLNNQSRSECLAIIRALREIGAKVPVEDDAQAMSKDALKESIYGEVKRLRWTDHSNLPDLKAIKKAKKAKKLAKKITEKLAEKSSEKEDTAQEDKPAKSYRSIRRNK